MSRAVWTSVRFAGSAAVLAVLVWLLGASPFLDGVRTVDGRALAVATGLAAITTLACAWRWQIVARALGFELPLPAAVAAYYRSLFLNVTLPGGVAGDVHRGLSHGRDAGDVRRALGAVAGERFAGQVVQALITVLVLVALPSPVHAFMLPVAIAVAVAAAVVVLVARRHAQLGARDWLGVALASAVVVLGHAATFLIAARTAGASAPTSRMLPLALLVMLVMVLPSAGGWGPREGGAAWAFGAAGLGAGVGVATAVVYGVMVLVASLPGAAVLVVSFCRRTWTAGGTEPQLAEGPAHA